MKEVSDILWYDHNENLPLLVPTTFSTEAPVLKTSMLNYLFLYSLAHQAPNEKQVH